MRRAGTYDHRNGLVEWEKRKLKTWIEGIFDAPQIRLKPGVTQDIRGHVRTEFESRGWAINVRIDPDYDLTVFAVKDDVAVQLQTGNMSRAPYDLLKMQYLHTARKIGAAALALPTKLGASALGSNIAHADRVFSELQLFSNIITVPILLIAFE